MAEDFEGMDLENGNAEETTTEQGEGGTTKEVTKTKKLTKVIEGTKLTITEGVTKAVLVFDFAGLPEEIQAKLGPYGMSQKLGDAAAGKSGQEAVDAINTVFKGLSEGNWTVRAPAGEKISKKEIEGNLAALPEEEKEAARALLERMGIKLG